ncbi:hypothetical protein WL50_05850 [Burkholderia ubonensis]|nr:hypothetical protein WL50_05850 [Burkholderia ubonensis]
MQFVANVAGEDFNLAPGVGNRREPSRFIGNVFGLLAFLPDDYRLATKRTCTVGQGNHRGLDPFFRTCFGKIVIALDCLDAIHHLVQLIVRQVGEFTVAIDSGDLLNELDVFLGIISVFLRCKFGN